VRGSMTRTPERRSRVRPLYRRCDGEDAV
jgi:hypothetical protein